MIDPGGSTCIQGSDKNILSFEHIPVSEYEAIESWSGPERALLTGLG